MKDLSGTLLPFISKQMAIVDATTRLIEVSIPSTPPAVLRLAACDRSVLYGNDSAGNPITWSAFPLAVGDFRETKTGDLTQLQIGIEDAKLELRAAIDSLDMIGQRVRVYTLNLGQVADPQAHLLYVSQITGVEADEKVVLFNLGRPSLNRGAFPARRSLPTCAVVRFGNADCGYIIPVGADDTIGGGFTFCPKSTEACDERGLDEAARGVTVLHPRRFDGFPGIGDGS